MGGGGATGRVAENPTKEVRRGGGGLWYAVAYNRSAGIGGFIYYGVSYYVSGHYSVCLVDEGMELFLREQSLMLMIRPRLR